MYTKAVPTGIKDPMRLKQRRDARVRRSRQEFEERCEVFGARTFRGERCVAEGVRVGRGDAEFDGYYTQLQACALKATKSAAALPADLSFHPSVDSDLASDLEKCSSKVISITNTLLNLASGSKNAKGKGKVRVRDDDDFLDRFGSLIVAPTGQVFERADIALDQVNGRTEAPAITINPPEPKKKTGPKGRQEPVIRHAPHVPNRSSSSSGRSTTRMASRGLPLCDTSLTRISSRDEDRTLDQFELCDELDDLNEIFTNPDIVKILHGAGKFLYFPRHGLASLLEIYCTVTSEPTSDTSSPIDASDEIVRYGRADIHLLLYIYDNLRNALLDHALSCSPYPTASRAGSPTAPNAFVRDVLSPLGETALRVYAPDPYDAEGGTGLNGWDTLARR
ncbi:hypothetical protein EI94DRAFT_1814583 [Lactarius quietus]|nr:hypothetical protein EI94DRAFT_1814583 [Lactarius quietus]